MPRNGMPKVNHVLRLNLRDEQAAILAYALLYVLAGDKETRAESRVLATAAGVQEDVDQVVVDFARETVLGVAGFPGHHYLSYPITLDTVFGVLLSTAKEEEKEGVIADDEIPF